ncbi:MAG: DHH family phosphoesterase [Bacteroidota bacterium]
MDSRLLPYLEEHTARLTPLLIVTHDYPDPDALASAFALMYLAQRKFGIGGKIVYGGSIGRSENHEMVRLLKIPAHKLRPSDFRHYPNIALVDTQPGFDNNSFPRNRRATIVIDQHTGSSPPNADFVLVDTNAGATSALLARELLQSGLEIPPNLATAIVYGILSDTLDFYRMTNRETIEIYLQLLRHADIRVLARIQNPSRPRRFFGDLAAGIDKARIRGTLIVSHLGTVESPEQVSQMADFLLTCEGVQWAFCSGRYREHLHLSLRTSLPDGQAASVLRDICNHPREAGGHGQIAGGKIRLLNASEAVSWSMLEEKLTEKLLTRIGVSQRTHFTPLVEARVLTAPIVPE